VVPAKDSSIPASCCLLFNWPHPPRRFVERTESTSLGDYRLPTPASRYQAFWSGQGRRCWWVLLPLPPRPIWSCRLGLRSAIPAARALLVAGRGFYLCFRTNVPLSYILFLCIETICLFLCY